MNNGQIITILSLTVDNGALEGEILTIDSLTRFDDVVTAEIDHATACLALADIAPETFEDVTESEIDDAVACLALVEV